MFFFKLLLYTQNYIQVYCTTITIYNIVSDLLQYSTYFSRHRDEEKVHFKVQKNVNYNIKFETETNNNMSLAGNLRHDEHSDDDSGAGFATVEESNIGKKTHNRGKFSSQIHI